MATHEESEEQPQYRQTADIPDDVVREIEQIPEIKDRLITGSVREDIRIAEEIRKYINAGNRHIEFDEEGALDAGINRRVVDTVANEIGRLNDALSDRLSEDEDCAGQTKVEGDKLYLNNCHAQAVAILVLAGAALITFLSVVAAIGSRAVAVIVGFVALILYLKGADILFCNSKGGMCGVILERGKVTPGGCTPQDCEELERALVIEGSGHPGSTYYEIEVSGELKQVEGMLEGYSVTINQNDQVSGNRATGTVSGGNDGFRFSGELRDVSLRNSSAAAVHTFGDNRPDNGPEARFDGPSTIVASEEATFDGTKSSVKGGKIVSYEWKAEMGTDILDSGTGETFSTEFPRQGTYSLHLTVTDKEGRTDTATKSIAVTDQRHTLVIKGSGHPGHTGYTIEVSGELEQVEGRLEGFKVTAQPNDRVSGNRATGKVGGGNDGFRFSGELRKVSLANPEGAAVYVNGDPIPIEDGDGGGDGDGNANGGDGGNGTNKSPVASLAISPQTVTKHKSVSFDGGGSSDPDGSIEKYSWTIRRNSAVVDTGSGKRYSNAYSDPGKYSVTLEVTDHKGATGTAKGSFTVKPF